MGAASCYPVGLKQLDLSHNRIRAWPTVARSESLESLESTVSSCYALAEINKSNKFLCPGTEMMSPMDNIKSFDYRETLL